MTDTIKWTDKLKGAFELVFMFGRGIAPFEKDPSKAAGLRSIWIPIVLMPLGQYCAYLWPSKDLAEQPMQTVQSIVALCTVVGFFAGLGILWLATVVFDRRDRFWVTFQATNWTGLAMSLVSLPFYLVALSGWYPHAQMDNVFLLLTYYGALLVSGCVAFRGLKIDWMMGGFLATLGIIIGQQIQNAMFWLFDVPINWGA
jgi:hypothetical protein